MEIVEITTKSQVDQFHELVKKVYQFDVHYVMPIVEDVEAVFNPSKNKRFKSGNAERWLLFDKGECVGRIAAFYENKNEKMNGAWGFFEVLENVEYANMLIQTAEAFLRMLTTGFTPLPPISPLLQPQSQSRQAPKDVSENENATRYCSFPRLLSYLSLAHFLYCWHHH